MLTLTGDIPAFGEAVFVFGDVVGKGVQGEVRGVRGEVEEEGVGGVVPRVLLKEADGVVGEGDGGVEAVLGLGLRKAFAIELDDARGEVAVLVADGEGVVEADALEGLESDVPFARVIGPVASGLRYSGRNLV